ncbi:hypothetical protein ACFX15_012199 [Malus domestica]
MIRTVIVARETLITLKEFRAQLLSAKRTVEDSPSSVYQGESSTHNDTHYNGNVGFVGQYQRQFGSHNGNAGFVGQYQRPSGNNGGYNGGQQFNFNRNRNNFRPRFNGGFNKPNVIPECQICGKRGHTTPNCFYRNE